MAKNYRNDILAIIVFFAISLAAQIIHYPVGVYDLDTDLWHRGDIISAIMNESLFAKDPFLSDSSMSKIATESYLHIPLLRLFNSYEGYVAFTSFVLYFAGMLLLYLLIKILTDDFFIASAVSIIFSSASIWFPPLGDIFAMVPIYGAVSKSVSYVYLLLILVLYFRSRNYKYINEIVMVMCGIMVWLNPLGFLGPGLAFACYILLDTFTKKRPFKMIILASILILAFLPYLYMYAGLSKSLPVISREDANFLQNILKTKFIIAWSPLSIFNALKEMILYTNVWAILALTVLLLPFVDRKRYYLRFFFVSAILIFFISLTLRLLGYYALDKNSSFLMVNRNLKWLYLYIFLALTSLYGDYRHAARKGARYVYVLAVFLLFLQPLKTTVSSTFGAKLYSKIGNIFPQLSFASGKFGLDIRDINSNSEEVARYIQSRLPSDIGLVGPTWIPYKTHRGLVFHPNYIYHFAEIKKIDECRKALEIDKALRSINAGIDTKEVLRTLKGFNVDYVLFEKFKRDPRSYCVRYVQDVQYTAVLKTFFKDDVVFENKHFILVRT